MFIHHIESLKIRQREIKADLFDMATKNQDGLLTTTFDVIANYFEGCLRILSDLHALIENADNKTYERMSDEVFKSNLNDMFVFDGWYLENIDFQKIPSFHNFNHYKRRILFNLEFKNCKLESLKFFQLNRFRFGSVTIKKSNVDYLYLPDSASFSFINIVDSNIGRILIESFDNGTIDVQKSKFLFFAARKAKLSRISFVNCIFGNKNHGNVCFDSCQIDDVTEFIRCKFNVSPSFHETKFYTGTTFEGSEFFDFSSSGCIGNYRVLKQNMENISADHEELLFHSLELAARRKMALPKIWEIWRADYNVTIASWFLFITNNYGRNYWLPWMWLILLTVGLSYLYFFLSGVTCSINHLSEADVWLKPYCMPNLELNYWKFLIFSAQKALGPLGLILDTGLLSPASVGVKVISVTQVIMSTILWYIIIVQIRRQFRL